MIAVKEKKATAFSKVGIVMVGGLRMLAEDPEKSMRVVSLA